MNNKLPVLIEDIDKDDDMYENIALVNKWAEYKVLSFNDVNGTSVVLTYTSSQDNNVSLFFIKE